MLSYELVPEGVKNAIWTSVTDVGSSKECLQRKLFFFIRQNLSFSSLTDEKRKKRRLMKGEKKMIEAMLASELYLHFSDFW